MNRRRPGRPEAGMVTVEIAFAVMAAAVVAREGAQTAAVPTVPWANANTFRPPPGAGASGMKIIPLIGTGSPCRPTPL